MSEASETVLTAAHAIERAVREGQKSDLVDRAAQPSTTGDTGRAIPKERQLVAEQ